MSPQHDRHLLRKARPYHLLTGALLFGLGAGLADYLGWGVRPGRYLLAQAWLTTLQLGIFLLGEKLGVDFSPGLIERLADIRQAADPGEPAPLEEEGGQLLIQLGLIFLLITAALTTWMGFLGWLNPVTLTLMGLLFSGYGLIILPGLQKTLWGFQEPLFSALIIILPAALSFGVQTGKMHRFLALSTFPLYALHLAGLLVLGLVTFRRDLRQRRLTLLTGIGWETGITLHNGLVVTGFFLMALGMFFDYPAGVVLPALTALLPGAYLVWYLSRLRLGAPTRWTWLVTLSQITLYLPLYYLLFSLWTY